MRSSALPRLLSHHPNTDILHERTAKRKDLGVKGLSDGKTKSPACSAIGTSFAGNIAVTSTSGPGLAARAKAHRPGVSPGLSRSSSSTCSAESPSTGLPTQDRTDRPQPRDTLRPQRRVAVAVVAPASPTDLLCDGLRDNTAHDAFIGNGSSAWRVPRPTNSRNQDARHTRRNAHADARQARPYTRRENLGRYWPVGGRGATHRLGGLEKDAATGAISTTSANHEKMVLLRREKIARSRRYPALEVPAIPMLRHYPHEIWGGTYGHLRTAAEELCRQGKSVAFAHFRYINPAARRTQAFSPLQNVIVAGAQRMFADFHSRRASRERTDHSNPIKSRARPFSVTEVCRKRPSKL